MRLLFDQNISHRILQFLPGIYSGSTTVKKEKLIDFPDKQIWEFAKKREFTIVTQDSDFNSLNILYGFPPKIIWIRTGNLKTKEIASVLKNHLSEIEKFSKDDKYGCLEIINIERV
jgi:predicted nuclease of predicted toxin-antitoxin system